jgi:hypothetical protein
MYIIKNYEFCDQDDITVLTNDEKFYFDTFEEARSFVEIKYGNNPKYNLDFLNNTFVDKIETESYMYIFEIIYTYLLIIEKSKD